MITKSFWLVWSPYTKYCSYRHLTFKSAKTEIKRLQKENPTRKFYILKAVATIYRKKPKKMPTKKQIENLIELIRRS
jgi:hypothetical protein